MHDFQFYDRDALEALQSKEHEYADRKNAIIAEIKVCFCCCAVCISCMCCMICLLNVLYVEWVVCVCVVSCGAPRQRSTITPTEKTPSSPIFEVRFG